MTQQQPQPHIRPGKGKYWECSEGFDTRKCSLICMCQSPPPCASHSSAGQQRIEQVIEELQRRKNSLDYPNSPPGNTYDKVIALLRGDQK